MRVLKSESRLGGPLPPAFFASTVYGNGGKPACITRGTRTGKSLRVHRPKQFPQILGPFWGKCAANRAICIGAGDRSGLADWLRRRSWSNRTQVEIERTRFGLQHRQQVAEIFPCCGLSNVLMLHQTLGSNTFLCSPGKPDCVTFVIRLSSPGLHQEDSFASRSEIRLKRQGALRVSSPGTCCSAA